MPVRWMTFGEIKRIMRPFNVYALNQIVADDDLMVKVANSRFDTKRGFHVSVGFEIEERSRGDKVTTKRTDRQLKLL